MFVIGILLSVVVGYGIFKLITPKGLANNPPDIGRKWLAQVAGLISLVALPSFFRDFGLDALFKWLVGLIFFGGLTYLIGWYYGKYSQSKESTHSSADLPRNDQKVSVQIGPGRIKTKEEWEEWKKGRLSNKINTERLVEDSLIKPRATRWPRFLARSFDLWWETLLIGFVFGVILGRFSIGFVEWINKPGTNMLFGIICLPLALILDAALYQIFGNTPGKALLGLKVTTIDGEPLSFKQYLQRNFSMWVSGLALGLPLLNLASLASQFQRLGKEKQASYDETTDFRVPSNPSSLLNKVVFGIALTGFVMVIAVLNNETNVAQRQMNLHKKPQYHSEEKLAQEEKAPIGIPAPFTETDLTGSAQSKDVSYYAEDAKIIKAPSKSVIVATKPLEITERAFSPNHLDEAKRLNDLGLVYKKQGNYAQAETLYNRALAIYEQTLSPDDPRVSMCLNNLGMLYYVQGQYARAEPFHNRALAIREKAFGSNNPYVAQSLNNLAILYHSEGLYGQAEPLFKRSLEIWEQTLSPDHPDVATGLKNMAALYRVTNRENEAERLEQRAARIRASKR
jgi:tetratricopeptide (TPR) repeat protein